MRGFSGLFAPEVASRRVTKHVSLRKAYTTHMKLMESPKAVLVQNDRLGIAMGGTWSAVAWKLKQNSLNHEACVFERN